MSTVIRIALADDHTMFRKGIAELLLGFGGFEILTDASNGRELIEKVEALPVPPDICLLDVNMPELNGYDTLAQMRQRWPGMKFLALSMYDHEFSIIKMLRNGANGYILKDSDPAQLKKALEDIYYKGFYHSELVSGRLISMLKQGTDYNQIQISEREQQFLIHCCSELTYKEIAQLMKLSVRTVEGYRDGLFEKLGLKSRSGLVIYALKNGLVTLNG